MEYGNSKKFLIVAVILAVLIVYGAQKQMGKISANKKLENIKLDYEKKEMQKIQNPDEEQENPDEEQENPDEVQDNPDEPQENPDENNAHDYNVEMQALESGRKAMEANRIEPATHKLVIAANSDDMEIKKSALTMLADCYKKLNNKDALIETYEKLLNLEEDQTVKNDIYLKLGNEYLKTGYFDKSLYMFKSRYENAPDVETAIKICEVYNSTENIEDLKNDLTDFLSRFPDDKDKFEKYIESIKQREPDYVPPSEEQE